MTDCSCTEAGWCERHQCHKTANWVRLCQTNEKYYQAWQEGRGPAQMVAAAIREYRVVAKLTPAETDSRLDICRACSEYCSQYRCKRWEMGCRNAFRNGLENPTSLCPLNKWESGKVEA